MLYEVITNVARQRYNDAVRVFNSSIRTFPNNLTNRFLLQLERKEPFVITPYSIHYTKLYDATRLGRWANDEILVWEISGQAFGSVVTGHEAAASTGQQLSVTRTPLRDRGMSKRRSDIV